MNMLNEPGLMASEMISPSSLLTDNLPLLAGAPNGIQKLRELILELAVRGKLVLQDPNDEPASELLTRIAEEKERLEAKGMIKKQKPLAKVASAEHLFDIPASWEWVRIGAVGHDWGQKTPNQDFTYIDVGSVNNAVGVIKDPQLIKAEEAPSRARKVVKPGTIIYSTIRPYLLNTAVVTQQYENEPIASTAFAIIHPYLEMPSRYFLWYLRSPVFVRYVESVQMGIAYPAINDRQFFNGLVPLPPLAEQHRIIAKVDELMALCDRLEAQQADAENTHARLVQALLDSLAQASDADDFAANWQRLAEHFHTLFTTESSIDALKQTLLQLAVVGKLVPQDPSDEPASELLKRIGEKKARLVAEGKLKKQKALSNISKEEPPFDLPHGWQWVRLGELGFTATGKTPSTNNPLFFKGQIPFVGPGQISINGCINDPEKWLTELGARESSLAEAGDILMVCIGGSIGKGAIADRQMAFNQQINSIRVVLADHRYVYRAVSEARFQQSVLSAATGSATPIINRSKWDDLLISVPPLPEQHRIVAKVDQLIFLCDQLKSRIGQCQQLQEYLANAFVKQAVA